MKNWVALVTSLPTENATARMRAWRGLKASGAAVIRDGVYLMPGLENCRATLEAVAQDIRGANGTALLLWVEPAAGHDFRVAFDRSAEYADLLADIAQARACLSIASVAEALKHARRLRKAYASLEAIDFFPGEARRQAESSLRDFEQQSALLSAPGEPAPVTRSIPRLNPQHYQGRTWATRLRPWIDRLACAWLIRRFIDPQASLLWLESAADCPSGAIGFDYDGATFTHVGARVSFEVLLASFGLESEPLLRIGAIVHFLDVGGVQPPEATGIERALAGLRDSIDDDDRLLAIASQLFDGLFASFEKALQS